MYMVLDGSWSLKVSKLGVETRDDGSWFQIQMALNWEEGVKICI